MVRRMPEEGQPDLQSVIARLGELEAELGAAREELARKDQIIAGLHQDPRVEGLTPRQARGNWCTCPRGAIVPVPWRDRSAPMLLPEVRPHAVGMQGLPTFVAMAQLVDDSIAAPDVTEHDLGWALHGTDADHMVLHHPAGGGWEAR